jgi:hypothetical protein
LRLTGNPMVRSSIVSRPLWSSASFNASAVSTPAVPHRWNFSQVGRAENQHATDPAARTIARLTEKLTAICVNPNVKLEEEDAPWPDQQIEEVRTDKAAQSWDSASRAKAACWERP